MAAAHEDRSRAGLAVRWAFCLAVGLAVWLAPRDLLEAIRLATGLTTRAPKHTAALLARPAIFIKLGIRLELGDCSA